MSVLELDNINVAMQREAERTTPTEGFPELPNIPAGRYSDPEFFKLEMAAWRRSWVFAIHGGEVPEPGCFMKWDRLNEPLVFVRGADNKVRCFYNICRHRANPVVTDERGKARGLMCPVHGWTYKLEGELINLRDKRDFVNLDTSCRSLVEVRCENLGELYFVNLDDDAKPLLDDLGAFGAEWQTYRPDQSVLIRRVGMTVKANYKIVQEANMEVSHVTLVHPEIVDKFLDYAATAITHFPNGHSIQATRTRKTNWTQSDVELPAIPEVVALSKAANIAFNVFPNNVIPLNSWGYPLQSYWPIDVETTYVENQWIAAAPATPATEAMWNELIETFNVVLQQDFQFCVEAQKSVSSAACRGLLMSCMERCVYYMHEELDRRIGIDKVPEHLRVKQMLGHLVVR